VRTLHVWIGYSIVAALGLLALWGAVTAAVRRGPGRVYWWVLAYAQGGILIQALVGVILLIGGGERGVLHYLYGAVFPVLVLGAAHWVAREALAERPWIAFSAAAFVAFGLTLRALMTGLGIG
jgi:hypothetical protein